MADTQGTKRTLSIVIPALDEEQAIGGTLARCLEARSAIQARGGVDAVEILVVSDGSRDRTEEIARAVPEVTVLAFERNRGYGAAIQCGFEHASGELLGFLDADGTCDPTFFAELCRALDEEGADVALGSRMGPESEMPRLRALGNLVFAWILGVLAQREVVDTASGMRVLRRECLPRLQPLPDGLNFTPAMSARILLEDRLRLVERPMPYAERIGRSKLSVVADGARFLHTIVTAAVCYRPARPLLLGAGLLGAGSALLALAPLLQWIASGRFEEWMIYRLLASSLLATLSSLLVCTGVVADRITATLRRDAGADDGRSVPALLRGAFARGPRRVIAAGLLTLGVATAWPGIVQYATTGHVDMHWSRAVLAALCIVLTAVLGVTAFLLGMLDLIVARRDRVRAAPAPDRVHRPS